MRDKLRAAELDQYIARHERRRKYARMTHDIRKAQEANHLRNELQRIEGVIFHRIGPGPREHVLFEHKREKLQQALKENLFDL